MKISKFASITHCLFVLGWLFVAPAQAAVVNVTFTEDVNSFTSTWVISDNGGGDFSGTDAVIGTYWQASLMATAVPVLQDTVAHVLGPHGEDFLASSADYGMLPMGYLEETSFVVHGDGHRDDYSMTSNFDAGVYNITLAGVHSIPIPAAVWLFGSGLGLLGWLRRRAS